MGHLRAMACILAMGATLAFGGCSDDINDKPPTGPFPNPFIPDSGTPDSGTPDADGSDAGTQLTDLARDLILNQTNETGTPTTTEDKNIVDSEPANAFPDSFFQ